MACGGVDGIEFADPTSSPRTISEKKTTAFSESDEDGKI